MNCSRSILLLLLCQVLCGSIAVKADALHPLQSVDTSSPRSTLTSFMKAIDAAYADFLEIRTSYMTSGRLYLSRNEKMKVDRIHDEMRTAARALDLSTLSTGMFTDKEMIARRVLQLKSILDRLDLPTPDLIPDTEIMGSLEFKRWTIPNTEITIQRIEKGPRAGEYLFTAETVERLPEFYEKMSEILYQTKGLPGWFEVYRNGTGGLAMFVPYKWTIEMPEWTRKIVFDQPVWRWIAIGILFIVSGVLCILVQKLMYFLSGILTLSNYYSHWGKFCWLLTLIIILPLIDYFLTYNLRVSGVLREVFTYSISTIIYVLLAWIVWLSADPVSNYITETKHMLSGSIDSQLIRLTVSLISIILVAAILIYGAQHLGFPAYSIIAGLGVGGLAIALAAQDSLANLLGSMVIMFEKPFRVGHYVLIADIEGVVESIGFRSIRIRTFYNSLVSIPNREVISKTVDNMEARQYRRIKTTIGVTYDTSSEKIEKFIEGVKNIILENEHTRKDYFHVVLNEFDEYSLNILLYIFLEVPDWQAELAQRQAIFMEILRLAESQGIRIAFPTETVHIESMPPNLNA